MKHEKITFELLSKLFVQLLQEPYPSAEKIYQTARPLGIEDSLAKQQIVFTRMRDGVRQVSPRLFRSEQQRQDILLLFQEVLEDIEEKIDSEEEDE